jgi:murein L,D-transpeptidase YafK
MVHLVGRTPWSARVAWVDPGEEIMVHGLPYGARGKGVAVTDQEIDEIWGLAGEGTPIRIGE